MAKKARRRKQSVLTQAQLAGTKQQENVNGEKVVVEAHVPEQMARAEVNFAEEYQYVITDLQRIGVLAAIMLAILIALNLFLN